MRGATRRGARLKGMVLVPVASVGLAIAGFALAAIVIASLIYGAIVQYRRAQEAIAEKRRLQGEADTREEAKRKRDLAREVEFSQIGFTVERTRVREERPALVRAAAGLIGDVGPRWEDTSLLVPKRWLLSRPLRLDPDGAEVVVDAVDDPGLPVAQALREALVEWRPRTSLGPRHLHISDAIVDLEEPPAGRYVNRDCYRVLGLEMSPDRVDLQLGRTSYFAALDEAVPLECDLVRAERAEQVEAEIGAWDGFVPLRDAVPDPFDLGARTTVASVSTLVLRRAADGSAEFWLHRRRTVGMVSGQTHVVPTGVFQPAIDDLPDVFARDAAPWWTVVRESAEELLGEWHIDDRAVAPDVYETDPALAGLEAARRAGPARPWLVGFGLDPLSYWLELLTVLVIDEADFDRIIGQPPRENGEGTLVGQTRPDGTFGGLPFTDEGIREALAIADLAPAADALLRLAWQHRAALV